MRTRKVSLGRLSGIVVAVALVVFLSGLLPQPILSAQANTGCPPSSDAFGAVTWSSSCIIDTDTTWGNGTLTLSGSLTVNAGATLSLWNMLVRFSSTADLQRNFAIYGTLVMESGALQSNDNYHWYLTSSGTPAKVVIEHATITGAGSGSTFGIVVSGGGRNRFAYDTIRGVNMQVIGVNGDYVGYSNISDYDDSLLNQHVVWMGSNSTFEHNTMWNITLGLQSAVVNYETYGNALFFANTLYLRANGKNALGFEIINEQSAQVHPIYPGQWVAQLTWNNVTFYYAAGGSNSAAFDNEFSERIYIAHNTVTYLSPSFGTECVEAGGMTNSLVEFNTCLGNSGGFGYGFYDYIYESALNTFRYNTIDRAQIGVIVQAGGNTFAHNTFTNLTSAAFYICPNSPCAGSSANTSNNAWYNNTLSYAAGSDLTHMSLSNAFYNIVLGHGAKSWTDGATEHAVNGDWLFFANAPIQRLQVSDQSDGHRTLYLTTAGQTYSDRESKASIADGASISLSGSIDPAGSVQGGTVFWSLNPVGTTSFYATATGPATVGLQNFVHDYTYNVTIENLVTYGVQHASVSTDAAGSANLSLDFGAAKTQYSIGITGSFPPPPGDTTPPAQVTDLRATAVGSTYALLEWTAPGDNGTVGQASQYDLRYSLTGPLDSATFGQGVVVPAPLPGLPGSTETLSVTGLQPATPYWFALRTADAVPNWSAVSDPASLTTLSSSGPNGSTGVPQVLSAWANVSTSTVDIVFSVPMDHVSVSSALNVVPSAAYHVEWVNDSHLRVLFDAPLLPGTEYRLSIAAGALDQNGHPLGTTYELPFTSSALLSGGAPWSILTWALLISAPVVASVLFVLYLSWSGKLPAVKRALRSLPRRLRIGGKSGRPRRPKIPPDEK